MTTTTARDLRAAYTRTLAAAAAAGIDVRTWALSEGSQTYGRAYRLVSADPEHGGHSRVLGTDDYLGMTRREAVATLTGIRAGLDMATATRGHGFETPVPAGAPTPADIWAAWHADKRNA